MSTFSASSRTSAINDQLKEMYLYFKDLYEELEQGKEGKKILIMHSFGYNVRIVTVQPFFGETEFILVIKDEGKDAKDQENFEMLKRIESDNQLKMGHYLNNILFLFQFRSSRKKVQVYFPYSVAGHRLNEISKTYRTANTLSELFKYAIYLFSSIFQLMVKTEIFCSFTSLYAMPCALQKLDSEPRIFLSDCKFVKKENLKLNVLSQDQGNLLSEITEAMRELVIDMQNDPNTGIFVLTEIEPSSAFASILLLKVNIIEHIQELDLDLDVEEDLEDLPLETVVFGVNAFIFYILYGCDSQYISYLLKLFSKMIENDDDTIIYFFNSIFVEIIDTSPKVFDRSIYSFFKEARILMTSPDPSELFPAFSALALLSSANMSELNNPQTHLGPEIINHIQSYLPGKFSLSKTDNNGPLQSRYKNEYPALHAVRNKIIVKKHKRKQEDPNPSLWKRSRYAFDDTMKYLADSEALIDMVRKGIKTGKSKLESFVPNTKRKREIGGNKKGKRSTRKNKRGTRKNKK